METAPGCRTLVIASVLLLVNTEAWADWPAYSSSWIGNDLPYSDGLFAHGSSSQDRREQGSFPQAVQGLAVRTDGLCAVSSCWGEVGITGGLARGGDWIATFNTWGARGDGSGAAVALGSRFAYVAWHQSDYDGWRGRTNGNGLPIVPPTGRHFFGVRRFSLNGQVAPWIGGNGGGFDGAFLLIAETEKRDAENDPAAHPVRGLVVDGQDRLHIADAEGKRILTVDGLTMAVVGERKLDFAPLFLACDSRDGLWIAEASGQHLFTPAGQRVVLPDGARAAGMSWNPARGELLVALGAPHHQVLRLRADGTVAGRLGRSLFDGPVRGAEGPMRFANLTGVGADAAGRLYTTEEIHGARLRCHDDTGRERWALRGLEFCDLAAPDPADDREVYTRDTHYRLDYSKPAGQQWSVVGQTLDAERYPDDSRRWLTFGDTVRVGPHLLRTSHGMGPPGGFGIARHRPDQGALFVPVAHFELDDRKPKTLWTDLDGDGQPGRDETAPLPIGFSVWAARLDSQGTVWLCGPGGAARIPVTRWDERGVPRFAAPEAVPFPEPFTFVNRLEYVAERDVMVVNGFTAEHPRPPHGARNTWGNHKNLGPVIARYDDWSKPSRRLRWQFVTASYATDWNSEYTHSLAVAGEHLFTCGNGMGQASPWIRAYDLATGREDTDDDRRILPFGRKDYGIIFDATYSIAAHRRSDGEYLIFAEENGHAKQFLYRWRPGRTAPPAPRGFDVRTAANGRSVRLSWKEAPGAASYQIERGLLGPDGWGPWTVVVARNTATGWDDVGVPPGSSARYRLRARAADGSLGSESVERYARTLAWEAEHLSDAGLLGVPPGASVTAWRGHWLSGPGPLSDNPPGGEALRFKPNAAGDTLTITLPNIPAGQWRVLAQFACAKGLGRCRLAVEGQDASFITEDLGVVVDGPYASHLNARPLRELPVVTLRAAAPLVLRLTALDARPVVLDSVRLEPAL
ncbi:MAG: hypothetical protein IPM17_09280 [Verrucomicrobia bacterium]|nr:hypothetical protein [Verrucomicrobiota bacterium]